MLIVDDDCVTGGATNGPSWIIKITLADLLWIDGVEVEIKTVEKLRVIKLCAARRPVMVMNHRRRRTPV